MKLRKTRSNLAVILTSFALCVSMPLLTACSWFDSSSTAPEAQGAPPPEGSSPVDTLPEGAPPPDEGTSPVATAAAEDKDEHRLRDGIVALVNDQPISAYDLKQRIALTMATSGIPNTPEIQKKLREQILEQLETESYQRQEAAKNDITVSSVEVDKQIQQILTDNHLTMDQLKEVMSRGHVAIQTLRAQIASSLLWKKAVQMQFAGRVNITPEAVDAELKRATEGASKAHYIVAEIFLPVDNPELDEKVLKDANGLEDQLKAGAPFSPLARQFSQSPSAATGGSIGIVYEGQLAPELNQTLAKMKTGDISAPVRAIGGYYILLLQQRLEPVGTKIEKQQAPQTLPATLPLARFLLPLSPKSPKAVLDNAIKIAGTIVTHISNCQVLPRIAKEVPGSVYMDLGNARLADLSPQIRDALSKTEPGGVTPPFMSDAGVEMLVRCDKAIVKLEVLKLPTREEIEGQLFEDQISAMARRYSRDLRRNAHIELR